MVAERLGAAPGEIVFTSGGTEADNLAVLGTLAARAERRRPRPTSVVCSAVEHAAVLEHAAGAAAARRRGTSGVPPSSSARRRSTATGVVDLGRSTTCSARTSAWSRSCWPTTRSGRSQPLDRGRARWSGAARRGPRCTPTPCRPRRSSTWPRPRRAPTWCRSAPTSWAGPRASGALVVRAGPPFAPLLHGGGQERERRSGTHDVAGAVGLATALSAVAASARRSSARVGALRDRLADGLIARGAGHRRERADGAGAAGPLPPPLRPASSRRSCLSCSTSAGVCASAGSAVCQRGPRAEPRAGRHGGPAGEARDGRAVQPRLHDDQRPTSSRPWRRSRRGGQARGADAGRGRQRERPGRRRRTTRRRWQNRVVRVLVAMSGGVDSSVAAALLVEPGHDVVGATLKLWGGPSDSGCCSVADVDDARRVAQQLGIAHHVFNFTDEFDAAVVGPYVAAHAAGRTPNPCIECNRHIKFDRLLERADPARLRCPGHRPPRPGRARRRRVPRLLRGADPTKDQSYVLSMLGQRPAGRVVLPVGAADQGRGPGARPTGSGCERRPSPTARTSASSTAHEGRAGSSGGGWRCTRPRWSTRTGRWSGRSTPSSW